MKPLDIRPAARLIAPICLALSGLWLALPSRAQTYHNVSNQKFRTVANGPQSALIVDVPNPGDTAAVREAALRQYRSSLDSQSPAIQKEIAMMRQQHLVRPNQQFDFTQAAIIRHNGRLALPSVRHTRAGGPPGSNDITFNVPVSLPAGEPGAWTLEKASALDRLANMVLKPELKSLLGLPLWHNKGATNATVTVLNLDPRLNKGDEVIGALVVINVVGTDDVRVEIQFPSFMDPQTEFLALSQAMVQAFHGPFRIGYDAWEQGMARAATVVAAQEIGTIPAPDNTPLDPTNGFYYTPLYDLLNQPALGNNTFTPPTKSDQAFNRTTLSGMLIPRLQMSSTAWLKCYMENHGFFRLFNAAYFDAFNANVNTANDVNALRAIAGGVVPNVEGQPFDQWFEQQFVLDTSVTPGPKIYAYPQPTFPTTTQGDDSGAAVFLVYYKTSLTPTGVGDETDMDGTVYPIFWDSTFQNHLILGSVPNAIPVTNGFGALAPFFTNIGGTPKDQMRVAMDFPINHEYTRVYFPTGQTGTMAAPNDFSGEFVGADAGQLSIQFESGATQNVTVVQGVFGGLGGPPNAFSRDTFTFTPAGGVPQTYRRNVLHRSGTAAPIFKFVTAGAPTTLTHVFQAGPQMISLPIKPLSGNMALALGAQADPKTLLLAQYRQDLPAADKYQRYPSLPTYQPGYGLWSSFNINLSATVKGQLTDAEKDISVPLLFGWNQIGTPYSMAPGLNATTMDISFSYLGGDSVDLAGAVANEWVAVGITGFSPSAGYVDILTSADPTVPKNTLEPWKGYWIRVRVTEGVTIIYSNPNNRSARALKVSRSSATPTKEMGSWSVPLLLRDSRGSVSGAHFGQSKQGAETFKSAQDAASPPPFSRAATLAVRFPHSDWDAGNGVGGDFLSDFRHSGTHSEWNVTVSVPRAQEPYTLTWSDTAKVPKGTRLTLLDKTSGSRTQMISASSYVFTPAQNEMVRSFQIVAEPRSASHLFIRNLSMDRPFNAPGRAAAPAVIRYELTADAETTVEIRMGGSIVRHLSAAGRAAQAGTNQIVWDLRDDRGRGLPAGPYTLEISAKNTEGERSRSILPVIITR